MASSEGSAWVFDCPLIDDISAAEFAAAPAGGFYWTPTPMQAQPPSQPIAATAPPNPPCVEINSSVDCNKGKEQLTNKRPRSECGAQPSTKACREKIRRDKLNERFLELGAILEPGKTPKMDKSAILNDAIRVVSELRTEAQKLKDSNESLQEKIKELKTNIQITSPQDVYIMAEKNELREEKQRLKAEKESLEQQIKFMNARPSLVAHPPVIPASAFTAPQGPAAGQKLMMPVIGYPGFPMWQFMPPSDVDTSDDPKSCPPVA